ncbi:hypothetical protein Ndes2526B_g07902 [Nannochloris sp. 'desiccata']|nr:hypothetical protein KSW81_002558 [Chlorella desiccata (nom. nud.)]KAH7617296.1 hypothetical protein NADE_007081 [Chlorella desiccata (nom. nud.)]
MQPLWEQSISFKKALAIAAVQKRRFDDEINQQEQKNGALEQQIEQLKLELDKYKTPSSPELLLNTCFNLGSHCSSAAAEEENSDFSLQLENLAISATLWNRAAEFLPPSIHAFLCQVLEYTARRRIGSQVDNNNENNTGAALASSLIFPSHLAAGTPTPTQALIQLTHAIISAPTSSASSTPHQTEEILVKAASCLGELCKHPHDCLTLQDFSLLQEFISTLSTAAYCSTSEKGVSNTENTYAIGEEHNENNTTPPTAAGALGEAPLSSSLNALRLLKAFQSSCGTGYLVLGCAAHTLKSFIHHLRGLVIGETINELHPPLPLTPSAEMRSEEESFSEESLVIACGKISRIVQYCLRELPSWSCELPFQDEFLREVATAVWDISAASKIIAPAHPETAKQGQRCAALLVSALQQMSHSTSRDDCRTTVMTDTRKNRF